MDQINILLIEDNKDNMILTTEALIKGKIINNISIIKNDKRAMDFLEKSSL